MCICIYMCVCICIYMCVYTVYVYIYMCVCMNFFYFYEMKWCKNFDTMLWNVMMFTKIKTEKVELLEKCV